MIEAELKARVHDPERMRALLEDAYGPGRYEVYRDTYYDDPAGELMGGDRELRIRTVHGAGGTRTVLTYKGARVDAASGSKPEYETGVEDGDAAHAILRGLGHVPRIAFEKRCSSYAFTVDGRRLLATLVRVPEIDGTFLEVETMAKDEGDLPGALAVVRGVLADLGVAVDDLTTELYTDAVAAARGPRHG
ncbi:class IV adenylate cyclase [Kitasatospora paracochleata]|uniref:Adenylate cyclase class 2 n=1 Tax=Kitasatospora paracochleata TaxID=58354 RepID=A0ABT1J0M0_9ACTN|nr:CYTH domain-containing protein [Kitasatospora paracochleata]MCP2310967.1 adenylate cyclase class 2 [Kitasatospora paracochleata]